MNGTAYYLQFSTTYCIPVCPYGQYEVLSDHTCKLCNINCATCDGQSTFCLSCSYVNTINIVYLHNNECITFCPTGYWQNSTIEADHQCSTCHDYCDSCDGPDNDECDICGNQTDAQNNTLIYYKDLYSRTCNPTCPDGQFIAEVNPNECVPCNSSCLLCVTESINCSKCNFGYFLYE